MSEEITCYVMFEKTSGLVGVQERNGTFEEQPDVIYIKETSFKKTDDYRTDYKGIKALVYVEVE